MKRLLTRLTTSLGSQLLIALFLTACGSGNGGQSDSGDPSDDPTGNEENPFAKDEVIQTIASDISEATASEDPSNVSIIYNFVWDAPFFYTIGRGYVVAAQELGFSPGTITLVNGDESQGEPQLLDMWDGDGTDAYISHWAGSIHGNYPEVPWFVLEPGDDVAPDDYMAGVTSDNGGIADVLYDAMLDALDGKTGKIAVYGAVDGPGYARGAAVKALLEDGGFTVVGSPSEETGDDGSVVKDLLDDAFESDPDIIGVIGTLGFHGGAIAEWLESNDFEAGQVAVVCTDFEVQVQDALARDYVSATAVQRQYWWGYLAGYVSYASAVLDEETLDSILAPHADANHVVTTRFDTVTHENADQYLEFLNDVGLME